MKFYPCRVCYKTYPKGVMEYDDVCSDYCLNNEKQKKQESNLFAHYPEELKQAFKKYHKDNPHIYKRFCELAKRMKATGRKYYSSKMLINVIRWETDLAGNDEFKINDKYQSFYGRLLVHHDPSFDGFFQFREREKFK